MDTPPKPSEAFPPPSAQTRITFARTLRQVLKLDEEQANQVVVLLQNYDQARSEIMDNYAKLAHEAVSVSPRPLVFEKGS
jgi:hypothetical protein